MTETYSISNPAHFNGTIPDIYQLQTKIIESLIATNISHITMTDDVVDIIFVSTISSGDKTILDGLVVAHSPITVVIYDNIFTVSTRSEITKNATYARLGIFHYDGSTAVGSIKKISIISHQDIDTINYSVRIYDKTNGLVIAENTFTNTVESANTMTPINNVPTDEAIFEIQGKGNNNKKYYISYVTLYT